MKEVEQEVPIIIEEENEQEEEYVDLYAEKK